MNKNKKFNKAGSIAISEILILLLGTIAVAYILGSEIKVVSAAPVAITTEPHRGSCYWEINRRTKGGSFYFYIYDGRNWWQGDIDNSKKDNPCPTTLIKTSGPGVATAVWKQGYQGANNEIVRGGVEEGQVCKCYEQLRSSSAAFREAVAAATQTTAGIQTGTTGGQQGGTTTGTIVDTPIIQVALGAVEYVLGVDIPFVEYAATAQPSADTSSPAAQPRHLNCFKRNDGLFFVYLKDNGDKYTTTFKTEGWYYRDPKWGDEYGYGGPGNLNDNTRIWNGETVGGKSREGNKGHDNCDSTYLALLTAATQQPAQQNPSHLNCFKKDETYYVYLSSSDSRYFKDAAFSTAGWYYRGGAEAGKGYYAGSAQQGSITEIWRRDDNLEKGSGKDCDSVFLTAQEIALAATVKPSADVSTEAPQAQGATGASAALIPTVSVFDEAAVRPAEALAAELVRPIVTSGPAGTPAATAAPQGLEESQPVSVPTPSAPGPSFPVIPDGSPTAVRSCEEGSEIIHTCEYLCKGKKADCKCISGSWVCENCANKCDTSKIEEREKAKLAEADRKKQIENLCWEAQRTGNYAYTEVQKCIRDGARKLLSAAARGTGAGGTGFFSSGFADRIKVSGPWIVGAWGAATAWRRTLHAAKQQIQDIFPWINEGAVEALANAGAVAIAGAGTIIGVFQKGGILSEKILGKAYGAVLGISIGAVALVTAITFLATYKKESQKTVIFECVPWQPELKGEDCDECNNNPLMPCSEYQCKSLGQGCELVNTEESGKALCIWKNIDDSAYPIIKPLESALLKDYKYTPDNKISPPDRGVMIDSDKTDTQVDCVPAFTPLSFGVELNEPGMCKIDIERKQSFEEMGFSMSSGLYQYNHTYALNVPGLEALEEAGIDIGSGDMSLYVKCQDANGNSNPAHFVFKFCVDEGPDETQPLIVTTDLLDGMPIAAGTQSVNINVYVNEPVEACKWSHEDESFESMEDAMDCTNGDELDDISSNGLYACNAVLDGISDNQDNKFYFRCKDLKGNMNSESYDFTIKGTRPLVISSAEPNATTIKDSTERVNVMLRAETSAGFNNGDATCSYKNNTQTERDYTLFSVTGSHTHTTDKDLWLAQGSYIYDIMCVDLGGNLDVERIFFDVEVDDDAPSVVRAYHEDIYLKIITNEQAECVYDIVKCHYDFDDGISMTAISDTTHFTEWNTQKSFYIKCRDRYRKEPDPDKCTIIVRPLYV